MGEVVRLSDRELTRRVKRGATLLDQRRPGWALEVDLRRLGGLKNDVLEQIYGDHENALEALGFPSIEENMDALYRGDELNSSLGRPSDFGFSHYRGDYGGDWRAAYQALRRVWRNEVKRRLRNSG